MKKLLLLTLSIAMGLTVTACENSGEIEQLRKENEELKQQIAELGGDAAISFGYIATSDTQTGSVKTSNTDTAPQDATISFGYVDTSEFPDCLTDGTYRCGTDFEPGDYYILSMYGAEAYYDVSDSVGSSTGGDRRIIRAIHAKNGQYIQLQNALLIPKADFNPSDWKKYGAFTVGKDLPAGDYKMSSISNEYNNSQYPLAISGITAAYQISTGSPLSDPVECELLFDKQTYLSLQEGQIIMINNAYLTKVD